MHNPFLTGPRIYLRPLEPSDATAAYASWLNDHETNRHLETGFFPSSVDGLSQYIARYRGRSDAIFLAMIMKSNDRHIGNIKLEPINWIHRTGLLGVLIGDRESRGQGFGTEAIGLVLHHAFTRLSLHRVGLGVTSDNQAAIRCYTKLGFREEGRWRESVVHEGARFDHVWMGILAHEFAALQPQSPCVR